MTTKARPGPRARALPAAAAAACLTAASSCSPGGGGGEDPSAWPSRPVTISCFADAGGGTDLVSRLVAKEMEPELGVKVNVVNRTSGRGGAAINHVAGSDRDGYQWGGFSESVLPACVLGITDTTAADWAYFMVAGAPGVISVPAASPHQTLDDLVAAAGAGPVKAAAGFTGGLWHTKLLTLSEAAGVGFQFVPFQGSQPSQLAALSGEVGAVLTSISEQADLILGGQLRPLAMVEAAGYELAGGPSIPAAAERFPAVAKTPVSQFLGFALPADTPAPILERVGQAFEAVMAKPAVAEYAASRHLDLLGYHGEEAARRAAAAESAWTWKLADLGIAVKPPSDFGIPRPE